MDINADSTLAHFQRMRARLFGIAYRMLGSRADADDMVQEAWLRWSGGATPPSLDSVDAWLVTIITRLCIDRLRAARQERDDYIGPWLPEPLIESASDSPEVRLELLSDISTAFMLMLERLGPEERAVFLLHEVFDFEHAEIAVMLQKTEAACRQLLHRARERARADKRRFDVERSTHTQVLEKFAQAMRSNDREQMAALFTSDANFRGDGGGKVRATMRVVQGGAAIARFFAGFAVKHPQIALRPAIINGLPGLLGTVDGKPDTVMSFDYAGERISAVYVVRNPDKLALAGAALA